MITIRLHDRITLQAPCLKRGNVPVGTVGTVVEFVRKLPTQIKVAWDTGTVSILLVGIDDFAVKSVCLECPACENSDPFYFSRDAASGLVYCDCGHEFDDGNR